MERTGDARHDKDIPSSSHNQPTSPSQNFNNPLHLFHNEACHLNYCCCKNRSSTFNLHSARIGSRDSFHSILQTLDHDQLPLPLLLLTSSFYCIVPRRHKIHKCALCICKHTSTSTTYRCKRGFLPMHTYNGKYAFSRGSSASTRACATRSWTS